MDLPGARVADHVRLDSRAEGAHRVEPLEEGDPLCHAQLGGGHRRVKGEALEPVSKTLVGILERCLHLREGEGEV